MGGGGLHQSPSLCRAVLGFPRENHRGHRGPEAGRRVYGVNPVSCTCRERRETRQGLGVWLEVVVVRGGSLTCCGYTGSIRVARQIARVSALQAQYRIDDESAEQYIHHGHVTHGGKETRLRGLNSERRWDMRRVK